jgi:lipid-A-disaccharide synthase
LAGNYGCYNPVVEKHLDWAYNPPQWIVPFNQDIAMSQDGENFNIFLSAAEPSADMHLANLVKAFERQPGTFNFVGLGGDLMVDAGCELLEKTAHKAVMTHNALVHVWRYLLLIRKTVRYLRENKPDLVILCDSPAFNFHIAAAAKKLGIPTLFYVAPQLWAWAPWRIKKLARLCDKLCCILPFEKHYFADRGIDVTFVGNPLFDPIKDACADNLRTYENFNAKNLKLAIMPGSRDAEIQSLWKPMQMIAKGLQRKYPNIDVTAVAADDDKKELLKSMQLLGFRCKYVMADVYTTAKQCDLTLVASGSATLQVAAAACPMVVMYQTSQTMWKLVGKRIITTPYLSLPNILAGDRIVEEFMPYFDSIDPILDRVQELIASPQLLAEMSGKLVDICKPFADNNAAANTAKIASEMMNPIQFDQPTQPLVDNESDQTPDEQVTPPADEQKQQTEPPKEDTPGKPDVDSGMLF